MTDEKIEFEGLIHDFVITNVDGFTLYLKAIWQDLLSRSDDIMKGVNKITFGNYYELPGLILDRLFALFDTNKNDYLDCNEFVSGMKTLFTESYEGFVKFMFDFYDFDKDGKIRREDIAIVLSYIPLNTQVSNSSYKLKFEK